MGTPIISFELLHSYCTYMKKKPTHFGTSATAFSETSIYRFGDEWDVPGKEEESQIIDKYVRKRGSPCKHKFRKYTLSLLTLETTHVEGYKDASVSKGGSFDLET